MIKVKEFLDRHFLSFEKSTAEQKSNGHYCVHGHWEYHSLDFYLGEEIIPISENGKIFKNIFYGNELYSYQRYKFRIRCSCNNETLRIDISENGKLIGHYGYLQTYAHIPRGEPDINGYYARSTDEEIIKYIQSFISDRIRDKKIDSILQ